MSHLRVKICGVTSLDDALRAVEAGADAIGLIFVEGTPRYVTPAVASAIVAGLPPFVCPVGGVFWQTIPPGARRPPSSTECGLAAVQLHGAEPPEVVAAMSRPTLKTIKVRESSDLAQLDRGQARRLSSRQSGAVERGRGAGTHLLDARPRGGQSGRA